MPTKLFFQGVQGANSEIAGANYFAGKDMTMLPCQSFEDVFQYVTQDPMAYGIIPIENSSAGSLHTNYDALMSQPVRIIGEVKHRVHHCLLGLEKIPFSEIAKVFSHPQALLQCQNYVKNKLPNAAPTQFFDTAASAMHVAKGMNPTYAAIASLESAETYGLKVLAEKIEDNEQNFTRFLIIESDTKPFKLDTDFSQYKTSIVYALKNMPGALHKSLAVFAMRDIDLLKIESRPIPGSPWQYLFYLDFQGAMTDVHCHKAVDHLQEITQYIKVLGTYRAG